MKFTKYSLNVSEAHAAVQAELPARFGLSAATGLLSTCADSEFTLKNVNAITIAKMALYEVVFLISVSLKGYGNTA